MVSCEDCIHYEVCDYRTPERYATIQELKNDCSHCIPTADVVPKSEVEHLEREVRLLTENSITVKYPHCVLGSYYAVLTKSLEDYEKVIADISSAAKADVAREIFAEIDDAMIDHARGDTTDHWLFVRISELKKKYT